MLLLDTNVVSQLRYDNDSGYGVRAFLDRAERGGQAAFIAAPTLGEIRRGAALPRLRGDIAFADQLDAWVADMEASFSDRILPFNAECANVWGLMIAPRANNLIDKQIAATALVYNLSLVTRNTRDFQGFGLTLINPFTKTH